MMGSQSEIGLHLNSEDGLYHRLFLGPGGPPPLVVKVLLLEGGSRLCGTPSHCQKIRRFGRKPVWYGLISLTAIFLILFVIMFVNIFASQLISDNGLQFFNNCGSPFLKSKTTLVCCQDCGYFPSRACCMTFNN